MQRERDSHGDAMKPMSSEVQVDESRRTRLYHMLGALARSSTDDLRREE